MTVSFEVVLAILIYCNTMSTAVRKI